MECLVDIIDDRVSSDNPQDKLKRFTKALHEVLALSRSTKHIIQRQLRRLEPTTSLKYRAYEVMLNVPVMSTYVEIGGSWPPMLRTNDCCLAFALFDYTPNFP